MNDNIKSYMLQQTNNLLINEITHVMAELHDRGIVIESTLFKSVNMISKTHDVGNA